ncbi:MAG: hypothetical protein ACXWZD_08995 [Actinomycetota bacterium]
MLRKDRERWGMSAGEAGWRLGRTRRQYVALEDGTTMPDSTTYDRIWEFFSWPDARGSFLSCSLQIETDPDDITRLRLIAALEKTVSWCVGRLEVPSWRDLTPDGRPGRMEMETSDSAVLIFVAAWTLGLLILYAIIKSAVKNAIKEVLHEQGIVNWMSNIYTAIGRPEGDPKR